MTDATAPGQAGQPSGDAIRVMICDDHALFRRGLVMVLESEDGIEVVGEAEDGQQAIDRVEDLAPDVVLMDVRMPRISGIEATRTIAERVPATKILMLTVSDEEDDLYDAIKAGATGYLRRPSGPWSGVRASSRRRWPRSCSLSSRAWPSGLMSGSQCPRPASPTASSRCSSSSPRG